MDLCSTLHGNPSNNFRLDQSGGPGSMAKTFFVVVTAEINNNNNKSVLKKVTYSLCLLFVKTEVQTVLWSVVVVGSTLF